MMARRLVALGALIAMTRFADAQVLHERVTVGGIKCANGVCWKEGRPQDGASAMVADGEIVPAPTGGAQPLPGEPIYRPRASGRRPRARHAQRLVARRLAVAARPGRDGSRDRSRAAGQAALSRAVQSGRLPLQAHDRARRRRRRRVAGAGRALDGAHAARGARRRSARESARDAFWGSIVDRLRARAVGAAAVGGGGGARPGGAGRAARSTCTFARDGADNQYVHVERRAGAIGWCGSPTRRSATSPASIPAGLRLARRAAPAAAGAAG